MQSNRSNILHSLDKPVLILFGLLLFFGWLNIYSASYVNDMSFSIDFSLQWVKQLLWIGFSLIIIILILSVDSKFYEAYAYIFYAIAIFVLVVTLFVGTNIKGSRSWITFGQIGIQPAEFAKAITAMALARLTTSHNFSLHNLRDIAKAFAITFFPAMLILLQNDTGSALVYGALLLVMYREGLSGAFLISVALAIFYFIVSLKTSAELVLSLVLFTPLVILFVQKNWRSLYLAGGVTVGLLLAWWALSNSGVMGLSYFGIIIICLIFLIGFFLVSSIFKNRAENLILVLFLSCSTLFVISSNYVFNNVLEQHHQTRILVLLGMKNDPLGAEYNVTQSKIAIGSGGFFGQGFLKGTQTHYNFVPEQSTDFIFSTMGEEWGFIGTTVVLFLFGYLIIRIIALSEKQRNPFNRMYGYSVASIIFFHVAINVGMTIGLMPVIGIPLPFFSYGGSSLWGFTFLLFVFLRLDANRNQNS